MLLVISYYIYKKRLEIFEYIYNQYFLLDINTYIKLHRYDVLGIEFIIFVFFENLKYFIETISIFFVDFFLTYISVVYDFFRELFEILFSDSVWIKLKIFLIKTIKSVYVTVNNFFDSFDLPIFFFFILFVLSTIASLFFLSFLGLYGVLFLNFITISLFWFSVVFYFNEFFYDNTFIKIHIGKWFTISSAIDVGFDMGIDSIAYSFMLLTVTIAASVYPYIYSYFRYEPNIERLAIFINLFVISMIFLVLSGNMFVLFLGWEMIGITSFLLINFWSAKVSALKSAFKAFAFNKLSDVSLFIAITYAYILTGDSDIWVFNFKINLYDKHYLNFVGYDVSVIELLSFFFITAAFVKSAQFGFHIWLPDSMDAPVPASALIHSATLVSAGVFLLLRLSPLFEASLYATYIVPIIGSFTAFIGGICAAYQSDIKRILAYSTISHCGFLMVCYSLHITEYTVLYLYVHGFFKACVFLCAGNIIRFSKNYQDFRKMGGFLLSLPFEFSYSFFCLINLCGLPFTIGFYIKHLIFTALSSDIPASAFVLTNIIFAAISGLIYSFKFIFYIFFDFRKTNKSLFLDCMDFSRGSFFFSNSNIASEFSIFFLLLISYYLCFLMYGCFLNKNTVGEGLDNGYLYNFLSFEFLWPSRAFLNNIAYFNWFVFLVIFSLIVSFWRVIYKNYHFFEILFFFYFS